MYDRHGRRCGRGLLRMNGDKRVREGKFSDGLGVVRLICSEYSIRHGGAEIGNLSWN